MCCRLLPKFRSRALFRGALVMAAAVELVSCGTHAPMPQATALQLFARGQALFGRGKWDKAKLEFESVIFNHPGAAIVDSAQFMIGMCYYRQRDYILAADEFSRVHTKYPTSPLVDDADLLQCRCLLRIAPRNSALDQEQTQTAIAQLKQFQDNHPLSPHLPAIDSLLHDAYGRLSKSDYRAGLLYYRMGQYQAARIYFQDMIDRYTDSPLVPDALFFMGEGQRRLDSLSSAIQYYEKIVYLYPDNPRAGKAKKRIAELARRRDQVQASE